MRTYVVTSNYTKQVSNNQLVPALLLQLETAREMNSPSRATRLAEENRTRPFTIARFQNTDPDRLSHYAGDCKPDEPDFLSRLNRLIAVSSLENRLWFCWGETLNCVMSFGFALVFKRAASGLPPNRRRFSSADIAVKQCNYKLLLCSYVTVYIYIHYMA